MAGGIGRVAGGGRQSGGVEVVRPEGGRDREGGGEEGGRDQWGSPDNYKPATIIDTETYTLSFVCMVYHPDCPKSTPGAVLTSLPHLIFLKKWAIMKVDKLPRFP